MAISRAVIDRNLKLQGQMNKSSRPINREIATRQKAWSDYTSMMGWLPNPDPVLKARGEDISVYYELTNDPHYGAVIASRKAGILSMEYHFDGEDDKVAEFMNEWLKSLNMYDIVSQMLDATTYGYQPMEISWQSDGRNIIPIDIVAKPADWFVFSPENEFKFRTKANSIEGEPLPRMKFLLPRHSPTYDNPYGKPTASQCFWPVIFRRNNFSFWAKFCEKYGMPFVYAKYQPGTKSTEISNILTSLENMVQDALAAFPDGADIEVLQNNSKSTSDIYDTFKKACNDEISKAVLGQTLTTEIGSTGSYAAADSHNDIRKEIILGDKHIIENQFNLLAKWVTLINFGENVQPPKFELYNEEDKLEKSGNAKVVNDMLISSGRKLSNDFYVRELGLQESDIEEMPQQSFPREFAEAVTKKDPISDYTDNIPASKMQEYSEDALEAVFSELSKSKDLKSFNKKLPSIFSDMNTKKLEDDLSDANTVVEMAGRIDGKENLDNDS